MWSEHSLGAITDSTPWISTTVVRRIMEANDATPAEAYAFSTISKGEAGQYRRGKWRIYPGVTGDDSASVPGAKTFGFGMLQATPGTWGPLGLDYLRQLGGRCVERIKALCGRVALRNPLVNGRMSYALFQWDGNTFGNWYGTRHLAYNPYARSVLTEADRRWLKLGGMLRLRTQ